MKTFELNDTTYRLPETWAEVPYHQAKRLIALEREELDTYERAARIVSILSGIDFDHLTSFPATLAFQLFMQLSFIESEKVRPIQHFTFEGENFYARPMAEEDFLAFILYHKLEKAFESTPEETIRYKMALLCRRDGESVQELNKDGGKLLEERAKRFDALPSDVVRGVDAFFLTLWAQYALTTQAYSEALTRREEAQRRLQATRERFTRIMTASGVGRVLPTAWRRRLHNYIMSITSRRAKSLAG